MPSASRSPSRSTCVGGASLNPLTLSTTTGGSALLSRMGVRVGLKVVLSSEVDTLSLPSCDTLEPGRTSSALSMFSVLWRFGLPLRCAGPMDIARFCFSGRGVGSASDSGGDAGVLEEARNHSSIRSKEKQEAMAAR